jgi:hypothetical protein
VMEADTAKITMTAADTAKIVARETRAKITAPTQTVGTVVPSGPMPVHHHKRHHHHHLNRWGQGEAVHQIEQYPNAL